MTENHDRYRNLELQTSSYLNANTNSVEKITSKLSSQNRGQVSNFHNRRVDSLSSAQIKLT